MKRILQHLFVLAAFICLGGAVFAQDGKKGWQVELKKIAFDFTSTEVKNAKEYNGFSDARLSADSQTAVRGALDFISDYHAEHYLWTNELTADYGRTKIRPVEGQTLTNENADKILLTTGYTQRLWKVQDVLGGFEAGPFFNLGYETEFTKPDNSPRKKILRGTAGVKLFEGRYIKSLFAAVVGERDFTYNPGASKLAWEAGFKIEQPVREGVTAKYSVLFRDYLSSSEKRDTDLDYEFSADARLEVSLYKNLYLAPFVSYYTAQAKYFGPRGENVYIGVSLSFSHLFSEAK
ncbi:MAG: hypothetical protein PUK74_03560 [Elusimicrobia bacterium]|nr:hypothetical protein [Elusimicrobiota bacterium]MDY5729537.1 hypothetical protein [Elusimicrobiaceae bacterium]